MSKQELEARLEKVEEQIWWLNMADRFRPDEEAQWNRLWAEKKRLEEQIRRLS